MRTKHFTFPFNYHAGGVDGMTSPYGSWSCPNTCYILSDSGNYLTRDAMADFGTCYATHNNIHDRFKNPRYEVVTARVWCWITDSDTLGWFGFHLEGGYQNESGLVFHRTSTTNVDLYVRGTDDTNLGNFSYFKIGSVDQYVSSNQWLEYGYVVDRAYANVDCDPHFPGCRAGTCKKGIYTDVWAGTHHYTPFSDVYPCVTCDGIDINYKDIRNPVIYAYNDYDGYPITAGFALDYIKYDLYYKNHPLRMWRPTGYGMRPTY